MKKNNVEIVAICDCDENRMNATAAECEKDTGKKPLLYKDYKKLLEDKSIDAVSLATPNHWHNDLHLPHPRVPFLGFRSLAIDTGTADK